MLRSVRGQRFGRGGRLGGAVLVLVMGCTAPNPAFHAEDLDRRMDGRGPALVPGDASKARSLDARAATSDAGARIEAPAAQNCTGTSRPVITGVLAPDSLAIDRDGTIYFNQGDGVAAWIDRLHPNGTRDLKWVVLSAGLPTRGMTIDSGRRTLYVTAGMMPARIQAIDVDALFPVPRTINSEFTDPNDLTVDFDGDVYVTEQSDGHIYRVTPAGVRDRFTDTPVGDVVRSTGPAGIAFWGAELLVGSKGPTLLFKMPLDDQGLEATRVPWGRVNDWANGIAIDQKNRVYVSIYNQDVAKRVVRVEGDGNTVVPQLTGGRFSSMAFGRGMLVCSDLYVAEPFGTLRVIMTDTPGMPVP